jgi:hypothetical protein
MLTDFSPLFVVAEFTKTGSQNLFWYHVEFLCLVEVFVLVEKKKNTDETFHCIIVLSLYVSLQIYIYL